MKDQAVLHNEFIMYLNQVQQPFQILVSILPETHKKVQTSSNESLIDEICGISIENMREVFVFLMIFIDIREDFIYKICTQ